MTEVLRPMKVEQLVDFLEVAPFCPKSKDDVLDRKFLETALARPTVDADTASEMEEAVRTRRKEDGSRKRDDMTEPKNGLRFSIMDERIVDHVRQLLIKCEKRP